MELNEVKRNLNNLIMYNNTKYELRACIIRKNSKGYYYQAEIKDLKCNSLIICKLEDIGEVKDE